MRIRLRPSHWNAVPGSPASSSAATYFSTSRTSSGSFGACFTTAPSGTPRDWVGGHGGSGGAELRDVGEGIGPLRRGAGEEEAAIGGAFLRPRGAAIRDGARRILREGEFLSKPALTRQRVGSERQHHH